MIDLMCLTADKSIEAAIDGILRRPQALGIPPFTFETVVHPRRDSGCFHEAGELLGGYVERARHALVVLDHDWAGVPAGSAADLEARLEVSLKSVGPEDWARAVVIEPELEAWVFVDSPHVPAALGWPDSLTTMRTRLEGEGLWAPGSRKPADPKAAVEWVLFQARRPLSSSIYRALAQKVSLTHCTDRAFVRLVDLLRTWFAADSQGD